MKEHVNNNKQQSRPKVFKSTAHNTDWHHVTMSMEGAVCRAHCISYICLSQSTS